MSAAGSPTPEYNWQEAVQEAIQNFINAVKAAFEKFLDLIKGILGDAITIE